MLLVCNAISLRDVRFGLVATSRVRADARTCPLFNYNGSNQTYIGVMAQEVQKIKPEAIVHGDDAYLRVF
jgi:hypothetical protein